MCACKPNNTVPFWKPVREYRKYKKEINDAIKGCLNRGEFTLGYYDDGGEEIGRFERSFAERLGARRCVMTGSGTQSLALAYRALGVKGGEVIAPSHTFVATIDQIVAMGATPILVDIGDDGLIDPAEVEKAITPNTKAITVVHLEGKVCDMGRIMEIADRHGIPVVEDAAQAIGATWKGKHVGTIGKIGCFSHYPAKILGCVGNAGSVTTDDDTLADRIAQLRCNCSIGKNQGKVEWGYNLEPDAIQAAVLNVKLKYLDDKLIRRRQIADIYDEAFAEFQSLTLPLRQDGETSRVYQDYVIRVPASSSEMAQYLRDSGIGILGINLKPNHAYEELWNDLPCHSLPKTDDYLLRQIRLPCNPEVKPKEVEKVIEAVRSFCRSKGW